MGTRTPTTHSIASQPSSETTIIADLKPSVIATYARLLFYLCVVCAISLTHIPLLYKAGLFGLVWLLVWGSQRYACPIKRLMITSGGRLQTIDAKGLTKETYRYRFTHVSAWHLGLRIDTKRLDLFLDSTDADSFHQLRRLAVLSLKR